MNSLNNVPPFGAGQGQGFAGAGSGFPGSDASAGAAVRRVIPPFLQGADKATEDRVKYRTEEVACCFSNFSLIFSFCNPFS